MDIIKSPINYTGNKYRILNQIKPHFPKETKCFVDVFSGGATVGINVNAKKVIFIDNNEKVINLLRYLSNNSFKKIVSNIEKIISIYKLSNSHKKGYKFYYDKKPCINKNNGLKNYNKKGFKKLKEDYNGLKNKNTNKANAMLYTLMIYGFNNDLRFNSKGEFNLPCGKTDFNRFNYEKIKKFNERAQNSNYEFICANYNDENVQRIIFSASYLYFDPPYLITNAVYNEASGWTENDEREFVLFLSKLIKHRKKFVLSNILEKDNGKIKNNILLNWIKFNPKLEVKKIEYHYKGASYNKKIRNGSEKEVIIING